MIYLDNAATSYPKPKTVLDEIIRCFHEVGANPGRGQHGPALEAGRCILAARRAVARLIGAKNPADIFFMANATQAINLAIKGLVKEGDTVVTTSIEHNSVMRPLAQLIKTKNIKVLRARHAGDGEIDLAHFRKMVKKPVRLVIATHASNVIGNILPVAEIAEIARTAGASLLIDAAQTVGCVPISVEQLGIDMLAFTGHKAMLGPQGTGGLYVRPNLEVAELIQGGTGSATKDGQPDVRPDRYESGTLNTWGISGLGAAVRFILDKTVEELHEDEQGKMIKLITGLKKMGGIMIYGPEVGTPRAPLVSVRAQGVDPIEMGRLMDQDFSIATRAGFHCAPDAHRVIGTYKTGTLRLSPGPFSTDEDIEAAIGAIAEIIIAARGRS